MGRLIREGIAEKRAGYGWNINTELTALDALDHTTQMRLILEPAALRLPSYHLPQGDIARLRRVEHDLLRSESFKTLGGSAIKVYLTMLDACGGIPDQSVTVSLRQLMTRTHLSCPTVIDSLTRLESLGLVVSTTHERGKVKTYYVPDPPSAESV